MKRLYIGISFLVAQVLVLGLLVGPLLGQDFLDGFRKYFENDQLSYAGIAHNVANGTSPFVEPYTLQGNSFYPSAWYTIIGLFSRATHISIFTSWQVLGIAMVCATTAVLGAVSLNLSGRAWAPVVPGAILWVGTLSTLVSGYWYSALSHHAVVWGPFGTYFALNAEVAGLCLLALALASLVWLSTRGRIITPRNRAILLGVTGGVIGLTASVQTYVFFSAVLIIALWASIEGQRGAGRRSRIVGAAAALAALLLARPVSGVLGHIPAFGFLLLGLLPGVWRSARSHPRAALTFSLPLAALAAPQLIRTATGLLRNDPFLTYRQGSTEALSVPIGSALLGALPMLVLALAALLALLKGRRGHAASALIAVMVGWWLLTYNDLWGFDQEPYRFFLQGLILTGLLTATVIPMADWHAWPARLLLLAGLVLTLLSLADVKGFWEYAHDSGVIPMADSRAQALTHITEGRDGLYIAGPCVDPGQLKVITGARVAWYNQGLAWPNEPGRIDGLKNLTASTSADPNVLRASGADFVISDTACDHQWQFSPSDRIPILAEQRYSDAGSVRLLQIQR